jgi:hypothetical protein
MKRSEVKWSEGKGWEGTAREGKGREGKGSEVKKIVVRMWSVRKCGEVEWREGHGEMWVHQFMTLHISLLLVFSV